MKVDGKNTLLTHLDVVVPASVDKEFLACYHTSFHVSTSTGSTKNKEQTMWIYVTTTSQCRPYSCGFHH